jgi:hypothetical protein
VATINGLFSLSFFLSFFFRLIANSPRRGCHRVLDGLLSNKNIRIPTRNKIGGHPYPPHYAIFGWKRGVFSPLSSSGSLLILPEGIVVGFCNLHGLLSNKNIRIPTNNKNSGTPLPPALCDFWVEKGGILKSCSRVPKLQI